MWSARVGWKGRVLRMGIRCVAVAAVGVLVTASDYGAARTSVTEGAAAVQKPDLAYARVLADGTLDVGRSWGVTQSMVRFVNDRFCFYLPFTPLTVMAVAGEMNHGGAVAQASLRGNDLGCPGDETAHAQIIRRHYSGTFPPYLESYEIGEGALYIVFVRKPALAVGELPYVYARVSANGVVDSSVSRGITTSMIRVFPGVPDTVTWQWRYCFYFPFTPRFVFVTPEHPLPRQTAGGMATQPVMPQYASFGDSQLCPGEESGSLVFYDHVLYKNDQRDPVLVASTRTTRPYAFSIFATTAAIPGFASARVTQLGGLATGGTGLAAANVYRVDDPEVLYCVDAPFRVGSLLAMNEARDLSGGKWQNVAHVSTIRQAWRMTVAGSCRTGEIQIGLTRLRPSQVFSQPNIFGSFDRGFWFHDSLLAEGRSNLLLIQSRIGG